MARYFFHIRSGGRVLKDQEGVELSGDSANASRAWRRAIIQVNNSFEGLPEGSAEWEFEVVDDRGQIVLTVPFDEAGERSSRTVGEHRQFER